VVYGVLTPFLTIFQLYNGDIAEILLAGRKGTINQQINSNTTSFFRFVNKRAIYRLGIISLAHVPVHVTDFRVVNVMSYILLEDKLNKNN
jgi:hypothetical protein